jgi:hypothetical protein
VSGPSVLQPYLAAFSTRNYSRIRPFDTQQTAILDSQPFAAGLARANEALPGDFPFLIGNRAFVIPAIQAVLISPLAYRFLVNDSTIDGLTLPAISADDAALFSSLLHFGSGKRLEIRDDNKEGLDRLSESLEKPRLRNGFLTSNSGWSLSRCRMQSGEWSGSGRWPSKRKRRRNWLRETLSKLVSMAGGTRWPGLTGLDSRENSSNLPG